MSGVYFANRYRAGCMLSLPVGLVRGENNRRGYVRRSWSVGLVDGGSIPPGSTIDDKPALSNLVHRTRRKAGFSFLTTHRLMIKLGRLGATVSIDIRGQLGAILGAGSSISQRVAPNVAY